MDLNTILIILGVIALIGLVGHGVWSNRREKSLYFEQKHTHSNPNFSVPPQDTTTRQMPKTPFHSATEIPVQQEPVSPQNTASSLQSIRITLPDSEPVVVPQQVEPEPEPVVDEPVVYEYRPEKSQATVSPQKAQTVQYSYSAEPEFNESLEENLPVSPMSQPKPIEPIQSAETETQPQTQQATSYIMLYVVATQNQQFQGTTLTAALDDLGFIFGRDNLYHRHLDLTIASPAIFSLANAMQPGTFDLYAMRRFSTPGVVLYMQVPSAGNDRTNLKIMIQAARNLAEQLGGFVLTDDERLFDETAEQEYLARL